MKLHSQLIKISRKEWPDIGRGLFFLTVSSVALLAYPHTIKNIIDEAIAQKDQSALNYAAFAAVGIFIVQSIASSLRYYFFTLAGEKIVKRMREKLFSQILGQSTSFFDQQKTGELIGRLSNDTAVLQNALSVNISMLVRSLVQVIGGIVMLFLTSFKLTVFILVIIPPLGFLAANFGKKVKAISRRTQDALASSTGVAEEGISNVRTVKAFAQEQFESLRYQQKLQTSFSLSKEKIGEVAKFTNFVSIIGLSSIVFIVWYGGTLVIRGELSVGTLTSFLLYVITVAFSVGMLGSLWTDFMSAFGASERIFELIDKDIEDINSGEGQINDGTLEFRDVTFSYPARPDYPILKGVGFTISPFETVAIVGPSGSGKSTITQLLMGFYQPQSGSISFDKQDIKNFSLKGIRESIGLVSQDPVLVSESIFENIKYGKHTASDEEVYDAAKKAFAHEFIISFPDQYMTLVGERGVQLSGGQKQRIAIARALLKNPKILILDEATSSLDSESEHLVQKALDEQVGRRSTLIIAHRLSTVKRADKILVLEDGKIIQAGNHDELFKNESGLYHKLVNRQFNQSKEII